jgi:hypothetical protein
MMVWLHRNMSELLDFKLSPCFEYCMCSFGYFPGVRLWFADVSELSVSSIFKGWVWSTKWVVRGERVFIPGPRLARAGRTNRGGRNQVVGGQRGWVSVEGGGIRYACQVAVGLLCLEWFARSSLSVCRTVTWHASLIPPPSTLTHPLWPPTTWFLPLLLVLPARANLGPGINTRSPLTTHLVLHTQPLKMELTEGSETSANHNLTPGKYPK